METYIQRLRRDGAIPRSMEATEIELRDHVPHFVSGLASLLLHAGSAGQEVSDVLRGGNAIQRMTLELHGAQRRRLGWGEAAVRRDLEVLRQTIETDIRRRAPHWPQLDEALEVLRRLFEQAERISLQGWHYAGEEGVSDRPGGDELWLGDDGLDG